MSSYTTQNPEFNRIYGELVGSVVDNTLLAINSQDLNRANQLLSEKFGINTDDVLEYPEHLKSVLVELYGGSYDSVLEKMKTLFAKASDENPISDFVDFLEN